MSSQFSSREAAKNEIERKLKADRDSYRPEGASWTSPEHAFSVIARPAKIWTYRTPGQEHGTMRLKFYWREDSVGYGVLAEHNGRWYLDFPKPPYLLYQRYAWTEAETAYVCESEAVSDLVESVGLAATATLGGLERVAKSDLSPLKGKHVVILPEFNEVGLNHAETAAQLCLGAGARSAKIFSGLGRNPEEELEKWLSERIRQFGDSATKKLLGHLAETLKPIVYVKPPEQPLKGPRVDLQCLTDVESEPLEWVFDSVIPSGRLTVLTAAPGVGKSLLMLELVAKVSRKERRGGEEEVGRGDETDGHVILFSTDGGVANTIRPRLSVLGADLSRVFVLRGIREVDDKTGEEMAWAFQLNRDLSIVESELRRLKAEGILVRMIVIDPIDGCMGDKNRQSQPDVDLLAARLSELAEETGVAVVIVMQTNERWAGPVNRLVTPSRRQRLAASGAFPAAAKSVWLVTKDDADPNGRLLLPVKTNLCAPGPGLGYSLEEGIVRWKTDPANKTVDEAVQTLSEQATHTNLIEARSELTRAMEWMKERLNGKKVHSLVVMKDALANLISDSTLKRAARRLKVQRKKQIGSEKWYWSFPEHNSHSICEEEPEVDPNSSQLQEQTSESNSSIETANSQTLNILTACAEVQNGD